MQAIRILSGSQSDGTAVPCHVRVSEKPPTCWKREPTLKSAFPPKFGAKNIFLLSKFAATFLSFPPSTPRYPRAIASAQLGFSSSVAAGLRISSAGHIHQGKIPPARIPSDTVPFRIDLLLGFRARVSNFSFFFGVRCFCPGLLVRSESLDQIGCAVAFMLNSMLSRSQNLEFRYHMVPGFGVCNHELASRSAERFQGA